MRSGEARLDGQTVLLTGASGGIGRELAAALVGRECRVVLSARPSDRLDALADELRAAGGHVEVVPADLSDPAEADSLVERAEAAAGPIGVLVNNAGMDLMSRYDRQSTAQIDAVLNVNLRAAMVLTAKALPGMLAAGGGHVSLVSSLAAKLPAPYAALYSSTKAGLIALARSLRVEYEDDPVTFSVVAPGFVRDAGIYARWASEGYPTPSAIGMVSMKRTVGAILAAIEDGDVERTVGRRTTRALNATMELSPRVVDRLASRTARAYFRRLTERGNAAAATAAD